jgi:hypothetical protein
LLLYLSVFICVYPWFHSSSAFAQDDSTPEIAINLAEGRVVMCAAKDAIIVATVDAHSEPGSRQPAIVPLGAVRLGVLLGAVEWVQPESKDKPVRLDSEMAGLASSVQNHAGQPQQGESASDIEAIGVAVLERFRQLAGQLHNKLNIPEEEPLLRLVLVDYVRDYGPEAWTIDYHIRQDALGNDIWRTRVLRPSYYQLYPPEKGQPHTLFEVHYPPVNRATAEPELLDLLRQNDPRLAKARAANAILSKSVGMVVDGQSQKSMAALDAEFLRTALPTVTAPDAKFSMAMVDYDRGFQWLIQPPKAERPPVDTTPREPDAPTLRHKSSE